MAACLAAAAAGSKAKTEDNFYFFLYSQNLQTFMKQKLLTIKTLLVGIVLMMGVNGAWASEIIESYDFGAFITANGAPNLTTSGDDIAQTGTSAKTGSVKVINNPTSNGNTLELNGRFAVDYQYNAGSQIRFIWRSSKNAYQHGLAGNWNNKGTADPQGAARFSVLNLKAGDKITFTYAKQNGKAADPYTCNASQLTGIAADAALASGTEYTMATDGNLDLYFTNNNFAISKIVIKTEGVEEMGAPAIAVKPNGTGRIITITPGVGNAGSAASATYYTTDGSDPTSSATRVEYIMPFEISSNSTIKAVSYLGATAGEVVSLDVEAGTAVKLNAPIIKQTSFTEQDGYYFHTYTFTADQSNLVGKPTATITYSFDGGAETEGSSLVAEYEGNLTVTVSAEGYESSQTTTRVYGGQFAKTYSFDAITEVTKNDGIDWTSGGNVTTVNGAGWSFASLDQVTYSLREDITLSNFVYARATTADTNQGFYARAGKGTVNYSLHGAEEIQFTMLDGSNVYATAATTSQRFDQYANIRKIEIFTPAHATIEVTDAGWATFYTPFALDFTKEDDYYTPGELTAYTAKLENGMVVLTKVDNVPAETGVVLKADEGDYYVPVAASSTTNKGDLMGSLTADIDVEDFDGLNFYVLSMNGDNEAQFRRADSGYIPAGKAYLPMGNGDARLLELAFDDATGIATVDVHVDVPLYDLQGRRVKTAKKGIYVVDGKKVIIK
jgi:hypothetical protein